MTTSNIFAAFAGGDLDRLIACIAKVRKEGLAIDEYAQAGINKGSGNVYIYSEEWTGTVYCNIAGQVSWLYSCPECGEEHGFETERECREYADKFEFKCESCIN